MLNFTLAVLLTVSLYLITRAFPRFKVDVLHGVIFNYFACVMTGLVVMATATPFKEISWGNTPNLLTLSMGCLFVVTFVSIGLTSQRVGVTAASLASNMSLVIPVLFGLFVFKNNNKEFTVLNYAGLLLALVALYYSTVKKAEATAETQVAQGASWVFPLLLFFGSGATNTMSNYLSMSYYRSDQLPVFIIIACIGAATIGTLLLLYRVVVHKDKVSFRSFLGGMVLGIPNFLSFYFLLKSLADFGNSAAFVFPIYNILCMLVSALFAYILFKEKLQRINQLGLLLAVIAIFLISYQELLP